MEKKERKPYAERNDIERLQSTWRKLHGLMQRREWSAAVTRAATAGEIAANIAVRHELHLKRGLEPEFVDHLLKWANGLAGKLNKILAPLKGASDQRKVLNELRNKASRINEQRNSVVHSGAFMNETEARETVDLARELVDALVKPYHPDFILLEPEKTSAKS